ncbi:MAG: hypothetical protein AAF316_10225 [Cyanobacteria bacterium P01_A01_bin.80]
MRIESVPNCTQLKTPSKNRKLFKSVVDLGNHWIKAYVEGYDLLREASWFSRCLTNTSDKLPGHVRYVNGIREDLINTCWVVGDQAVRTGSSNLIRLVEDYTGKSSLWLEYFLGTLAHLPQINSQVIYSQHLRQAVGVGFSKTKKFDKSLNHLQTKAV